MRFGAHPGWPSSVSHQPAGLVALDLAGVFVFALSGGLAAVGARLDLFGSSWSRRLPRSEAASCATPCSARPRPSLRHWPYRAVPAGAAVDGFWRRPQVSRLRRLTLLADWGLFTVAGTRRALRRVADRSSPRDLRLADRRVVAPAVGAHVPDRSRSGQARESRPLELMRRCPGHSSGASSRAGTGEIMRRVA